MPPKIAYNTLPILLKSHMLTVFLEAPPKMTVAELKRDALSALASNVVNASVQSVDDFEICREIKERRLPTGKFETLDAGTIVKDVAVAYEVLFMRFRENGRLLPVEYTPPPILGEDDEPEPEPGSSKGKRKAEDTG